MRFVKGALALGAGVAAYALIEPYRFRVSRVEVPVEGLRDRLTVLHLADTHLTASDGARARFLARIPDILDAVPDLVFATGDMIDDNTGIEPLMDALRNIDARHGKFYVLGSHDYFQTKWKPPTKYFTGEQMTPELRAADTARLEQQLHDQGWTAVTNTTEHLKIGRTQLRIAGVDDPYLDRHRTDHIARGASDDVAIALVHAPNVVSEWLLNRFDLVLAGHTHGGQVRVPFIGALVTNSSLPNALAMGLHRIGSGHLYVSPGLGHSRFSPIRFLARPTATLLELVPRL